MSIPGVFTDMATMEDIIIRKTDQSLSTVK